MNKKLTGLILGLALMFGAISTATAKVVNVWGSTSFVTPVSNFYDGLADHSSTIINGSLDSNDLAGVDLLWVIQPQVALTAPENAHLETFLEGGGRIAYMAEHCTFNPPMNANINASLTAVGSNILIACGTTQDGGLHIASKANNQILDHTLTDDVNTYEYAAFAPLSLGGSAQTLMVGTDLTSIMMGFENIGAGSIFLITDQNVLNFDGTYDNDMMFQNLLIGITGAPPPVDNQPAVPVPALGILPLALLILLVGLGGVLIVRRT